MSLRIMNKAYIGWLVGGLELWNVTGKEEFMAIALALGMLNSNQP